MNEEERPINAELASAYLDGELEPGERASAEANPDVMAMVDSFTRVRAALGEIELVAGSTKTAAIAAALAEFDVRQTAGAAAAKTATITSLQSRRLRAYRLLSGVAAAAVIGVVAVAALNSSGDDDKASSAIEATATDAAGAAPAAELPSTKIAADTAAPSETSAAAGGEVPMQSATAAVAVIESRDDLVRYAANLEAADSAAQPTTTVAASEANPAPADSGYSQPSCRTSDQTVLGPILFQGTPAFAVRDVATGFIQAIDAVDCRVLLEVAP